MSYVTTKMNIFDIKKNDHLTGIHTHQRLVQNQTDYIYLEKKCTYVHVNNDYFLLKLRLSQS